MRYQSAELTFKQLAQWRGEPYWQYRWRR